MSKVTQVNAQSAAVAEMAKEWPLIDALVGGTSAMRAAGVKFLPKFPAEDDASYTARLNNSVLFPAFTHTAVVMTAKPFARRMKTTAPSERVEALFEDVDQLGTDLAPFAASVFLEVMQYGLHGVLIDVPKREPGVATVAAERAAGVRPYFTNYPAKSILGWRTKRSGTKFELTQLRLAETVVEEDGAFGEKIVDQVRVLTPGKFEIWRKAQAQDAQGMEWVIHETGMMTIKRIPFVFFYGVRKGFGIGRPPLLEIAHMNHEHWVSASDQRNILHVARVPILFASGVSDSDAIVVGAQTAARATDPDAKLQFVEHSGKAIEAGRQDLLDIEERMRMAGAELVAKRNSVKTRAQVVTESEGGKSILQMIAEGFEESLEQCVEIMGEWIGETGEVEVELFKEFGDDGFEQGGADFVLRAAKDGHLSSETVHETLKRGGTLPHDAEWSTEKQRLASQPQKPEPGKTLAGNDA